MITCFRRPCCCRKCSSLQNKQLSPERALPSGRQQGLGAPGQAESKQQPRAAHSCLWRRLADLEVEAPAPGSFSQSDVDGGLSSPSLAARPWGVSHPTPALGALAAARIFSKSPRLSVRSSAE